MKRWPTVLVAILLGCAGHRPPTTPPTTPPDAPPAIDNPIVVPTPTPVPTPQPPVAGPPLNPEAPRPKPFKYFKSGRPCVGGAGYQDCKGGEPNCICHRELSKAIHGVPFSVPPYQGPEDPAEQFKNGGSENWFPSCRAVKLYQDGNTKWWEDYFDLNYLGREPFSAYFSDTIGNVLVVRKWAETHNKPVLEARASAWLRSTWAYLAIMAVQESTRTYAAWHHVQAPGSKEFDTSPASWVGNYGVALPLNRGYVNSYVVGSGLMDLLLSLALDHPNRVYRWSLDGHAANAICGMAKVLYYPYNNVTGKVDFQAVTPAASDFGLTPAERDLLKRFIWSGGKTGFAQVEAMLDPYELGCDLTVLRTDRGVSAWFGKPDGRTALCSRAKGGSFVAVTVTGGTATSLSRATIENSPEAATIWRDGDQLCEESEKLPTKCIDVVGGTQVYYLHRPKGGL